MKMNKLFAGLIAFVAGVALSAGSALATNGYRTGDSTMMKLVPYFETGANRATLIAVQNMSSQEQDTMNKNQDVANIKSFLAGNALPDTMVRGAIARGLINEEHVGTDIAATTMLDAATMPDLMAAAERALATAEGMTHTEHVFVTVNVYDKMGMMMDGASATLCLAENQFGFVILQGPEMQDWQMEIPNQGMILSAMGGDIPEYGYVKVMAGNMKYQSCSITSPAGIMGVDTRAATSDTDTTLTGENTGMTEKSMIAAWAIVQDTGMGFFGTEIPTATISMESNVGTLPAADATADDGDPELACYTSPTFDTGGTAPTADQLPHSTGNFMMDRCGLVPERHTMGPLNETGTTNNANAFARYDAMADSMTYVWLAKGMDTDETLPKDRRMLEVVVMCMDGSMPPGPDRNGDNRPDPIMVAAPNMVNMIDPHDDALDPFVHMCDDSRGVLKITMPNGSHAGMVFTHISQMGNSYRMNFPGYSMAPPMDFCSATLPANAADSACK